jgi:hypothetical protein
MTKKIKEEKDKYHVFSRYGTNRSDNNEWEYFGDYDTKELAEKHMEMQGEPEDIQYMVIKGKQLEYEDGVAIYPFIILEEEEEK